MGIARLDRTQNIFRQVPGATLAAFLVDAELDRRAVAGVISLAVDHQGNDVAGLHLYVARRRQQLGSAALDGPLGEEPDAAGRLLHHAPRNTVAARLHAGDPGADPDLRGDRAAPADAHIAVLSRVDCHTARGKRNIAVSHDGRACSVDGKPGGPLRAPATQVSVAEQIVQPVAKKILCDGLRFVGSPARLRTGVDGSDAPHEEPVFGRQNGAVLQIGRQEGEVPRLRLNRYDRPRQVRRRRDVRPHSPPRGNADVEHAQPHAAARGGPLGGRGSPLPRPDRNRAIVAGQRLHVAQHSVIDLNAAIVIQGGGVGPEAPLDLQVRLLPHVGAECLDLRHGVGRGVFRPALRVADAQHQAERVLRDREDVRAAVWR